MDDAFVVRVWSASAIWRVISRACSDRESSFAHEPRPQRLAVDVRHDEVERARGLARVVERQDERMAEIREHADLAMEALRVRRGTSPRRTLIATGRSCRTSCARYTVAMPPAPSSRSMT